ncbi:MAG: hypothetical protein U5K79_23235 [Cyclobacteriaceae bacterium]|nr:hypothetical protein [Cyclobacteriaceae bacterium]
MYSLPGETIISYSVFSYEWFENNLSGNQIYPAIPGDSVLTDLPAMNYAVRIMDSATRCTSVEYASIINLPASGPVLNNILLTGLTSCMSPDGILGYEISPLQQVPPTNVLNRGYTLYLKTTLPLPILRLWV